MSPRARMLGCVIALAACGPGAAAAQAITIPPEPAPVMLVQQNAGIRLTAPSLSNGVATVTTSNFTIAGTVGHPLANATRVTIYEVLPSGARRTLATVTPPCFRGCGTFLAQSRFGPVFTSAPDVNESRNYLVHVDAFRNGQLLSGFEQPFTLRRIPNPDTLNIYATGMQATQGIQTDVVAVDRRRSTQAPPRPALPTEDGATMVEGKQTVVRVFAAADGSDTFSLSGVEARLEGTRNGQPLPGSPLAPVMTGGVSDGTDVDDFSALRTRGLNSDNFSINFRLPLGWRRGTVRLRAIVNAPGTPGHFTECAGCEDRANEVRAQVTFTATPKLRVAAWQMNFEFPTATVTSETRPIADFFAPLVDTFPIRAGNLLLGGYKGTIVTKTFKCEDILGDLFWNTFLSFEPGLRIGVLPSDPLICMAYANDDDPANDRSATGLSDGSLAATTFGGDGLTPPHELAHSLGIPHFSCDHGERDGGGCLNTYPVADGALDGPGYDLRALRPIPQVDPADTDLTHTHDLMSYGAPTWISRYTFEYLLSALRSRAGDDGVASSAAVRGGALPAPRLLVSGSITTAGRVVLTHLLSADGVPLDRPQPTGPYELRALAANGAILQTQRFAPRYATHSTGVGMFTFTLPDPGRIAAVTVVRDGVELLRRTRSPATPTLTWDDKSVDRLTATGVRSVPFQAADADRDPLRYALQFSADAGRTWNVVANAQGEDRRFNIVLDNLPATSAGRFRVLASDGFNTRLVASPRAVVVPNHAPSARILGPEHGTTLMAGDSLDAIGASTDSDQPAGTPGLRWSSNRDGDFGTGAEATLLRPSIGRHRVMLEARDAQGASGAAAITVNVVRGAADRKAPLVRSVTRERGRFRVRFSEEVVGLGSRGLRLEVAGKPVATSVGAGVRDVLLTPAGRLGKGTVRVRLTGRITDLGGNRVKTTLVAVR